MSELPERPEGLTTHMRVALSDHLRIKTLAAEQGRSQAAVVRDVLAYGLVVERLRASHPEVAHRLIAEIYAADDAAHSYGTLDDAVAHAVALAAERLGVSVAEVEAAVEARLAAEDAEA